MAEETKDRVVLQLGVMEEAKSHCKKYRDSVTEGLVELENILSTLFKSGFQGEAATGFKEFYDNKVKKVFGENEAFEQYLGMFDRQGNGLFDCIEKALITDKGVDPSLGENNRTIG